MSVNKELVKGSTSMLVLGVLEEKEMYGYQIIKELEQRSETVLSLKEGTLYPILHVLEQDGFLEVPENKLPDEEGLLLIGTFLVCG